jgi:hypothetical protein
VCFGPLKTLTTLYESEFDEHFALPFNYTIVSETITKHNTLITIDPYIALPYNDINSFIIRTDVSTFVSGAMLYQIEPIMDTTSNSPQSLIIKQLIFAYISRKSHSIEMQYTTYDKELLGIKDSLKY